MNREQLQEMVNWLSDQIDYANEAIHEAHNAHNYGRESQYEGIRDAFMRCLNKIKKEA